jgi:hypothetical protein
LQLLARRQQPVQAGHSHIDEALDFVAEDLRHHGSFLGHGQIAGSCRHDEYRSGSGPGLRPGEVNSACQRIPDGLGKSGSEPFSDDFAHAGAEERTARRFQALANSQHLVRGLPLAKHDFWLTLTKDAVMVYPSE